MHPIRILMTAAGLTIACWGTSVSNVAAQAALVDYESSAKAAQSREQAQWRLAFRPPLAVTAQTVAQLRASSNVAPEVIAEAERLLAQASQQAEPEARRALWRAATLLQGKSWTPQQELLGALTLRTSSPISAGGKDAVLLQLLYPVSVKPRARFSLDLLKAEPTSSATPKRGEQVRRVIEGELGGRLPREIDVNLAGVPDGAYLLIAKVSVGTDASAELAQSLYVIRDLTSRSQALKAKLNSIEGHEAAKWTAEYPFVLAEALEAGTRQIISYDFPQAIARSERIVAQLNGGRDEVWQAKGLQDRAHALEQTGELVPYQLYVPSAWTPEKRWPLVVALHGANLDETNMLGRAAAQMQKLAEQYGLVVVAPLGYKLNSWYGSERTPDGGAHVNETPEDVRRRQLSEQDVLQVMGLVEKEYSIDPRRRYLTGNSMGGGGTWWIGGHHPEVWAAIAPVAYGGVLPQDVPGLSRIPVLVVVGDHDELGMLGRVRSSLSVLEAGGVHPEYIEVTGGTHASAFDTALPRIFEFFRAHTR